MLHWTTGARFALVVHHTDETREGACDCKSSIGRLDQALTEAATRGWTVVDMARDWPPIYLPSGD